MVAKGPRDLVDEAVMEALTVAMELMVLLENAETKETEDRKE